MSALDVAWRDLRDRAAAADRAGDWQERTVLEVLAHVADYVKRVGDHPESAHYRADKASELGYWAVRLLKVTFLAYADWPNDPQDGAFLGAVDALDHARAAVTDALWALTQHDGVIYQSDATRISGEARGFTRWAQRIAADAVPDPDDEGW